MQQFSYFDRFICGVLDNPINGILIEPIQNVETRGASSEFFQVLQQIASNYGVFLVFDESKTGCGVTGKFWCHEHFSLLPDAFTFGHKTQIAGYFHNTKLKLVHGFLYIIL